MDNPHVTGKNSQCDCSLYNHNWEEFYRLLSIAANYPLSSSGLTLTVPPFLFFRTASPQMTATSTLVPSHIFKLTQLRNANLYIIRSKFYSSEWKKQKAKELKKLDFRYEME